MSNEQIILQIVLVFFVHKVTFFLKKIHKNCCNQSCTKSFVSRSFTLYPTRGAHCAVQTPSYIWGSTSKGRQGEGDGRGEHGKGKGSSPSWCYSHSDASGL